MKVDSKRRIVLPQDECDRYGIRPGTEVDVYAEGGRLIIEIEEDPADIIARLEATIADASAERERRGGFSPPDDGDLDPIARDHVETIRRGAERADAGEESNE